MSEMLNLVRACVEGGDIRVSNHGGAELRNDSVPLEAVLDSVAWAIVVEEYPSAFKGPSVLALHRLGDGTPLHVVWGFAIGTSMPVVLVTAYRPDPQRWSIDFTTREGR